MNLEHQLQVAASISGHVAVGIAYLGIAVVLRMYVKAAVRDARVVTRMFTLFAYFTAACGIQHLIAAALYICWQLQWPYITSLWITAALAIVTLIFIWQWRPLDPKVRDIVIAHS